MVIEMGSTLLYVMTHGFDEWRPHELQWISSGRVVKINSIDTATPEPTPRGFIISSRKWTLMSPADESTPGSVLIWILLNLPCETGRHVDLS